MYVDVGVVVRVYIRSRMAYVLKCGMRYIPLFAEVVVVVDVRC